MTNLKIDGAERAVNGAVCARLTSVVCDGATSYTAVPADEAHLGVIARQAERWIAFVGERTRMTPRVVTAKALSSLAYSVHHGARSLAVPSKLSGTLAHQRTLWALVRDGYKPFEVLALDTVSTDGIAVSLGDEPLGSIQPKHAPWARPLLAFGLTVHLARVTGSDREGYTLGANVVFGGVGRALDALLDALGATVRPASHPSGPRAGSGDGASPGAAQAATCPAGAAAAALGVPALTLVPSGDGGSVHACPVIRPEKGTGTPRPASQACPQDVVLWRRIDGTACASVEHAVRHSPSGIEWGYSGSGPADLARSILLALTDEATADALYQAFKAEVVARIPFAGGVLRADDVRAWTAAQDAPRPAA